MKLSKTVNPGSIKIGNRWARVFVTITYDTESGRFSMSGVEGPHSSGHAYGGCGQICMGYAHRNSDHNDSRYSHPKKLDKYNEGWNESLWQDLLTIWRTYHLNDVQAACEHQRILGWTWKTHPSEECPICGYRMGTAWKSFEIPSWVLLWVGLLPESKVDMPGAWHKEDTPNDLWRMYHPAAQKEGE